MYDDTLSPEWNEAYLLGVADYPINSNPYGLGQMLQWSAYFAGWSDAYRGLA